ncbi:glycosyltransferase family 2 protein [Aureitalea sp. L0-47]|uniref:cellulose synthase family protein n=1 Tax=Aureitalea sp. L0-47 TaxID=2816962 RepID=UPI0022390EAC|nr:cellulose synthase family protein [Aureitalea sp. L0-47]MCW5518526.1 glycosyltransferase family 2 protein [Aureitalea sp. L0-47]
MIAKIVFYLWVLLNLLLAIYILLELLLLLFALLAPKKNPKKDLKEWPKVTVQLPVFNEKYVVERLIEAVCALKYPKDLLEIQVLDDSTDETSEIIAKQIASLQIKGISIKHVQRKDRKGFKAGALDHAMEFCEGEFIAIFDADFIPDPDFLLNAIPYFQNEKIGFVQTRWSHINEKFSFITRAQAIMLNTHFSVEHLGRSHSGAFINFNGTAGVWRKSCIENAGGWHDDTLTEDLDLSFRAQMKGWKFKYLFNVESPSELPVTLDAYKTQQFRWSKGAAECFRKNIGKLWTSKSGIWPKIVGTAHMLNSSVFIIVLLLILVSPAIYWMANEGMVDVASAAFISNLSLGMTASIALLFFLGHLMTARSKWKEALFFLPNFYLFLALSVSISAYMVMGILQGYFGMRSDFNRTPKYNIRINDNRSLKLEYSFKKEQSILLVELIILGFGALILATGLYDRNFFMINYGLIICIGYVLNVFFPKRIFRL